MIDIKQYIESGILEDYLTGTLTDVERQEVENTADKHPEIAQELASMSLSLSVFADIGAAEPAPYMESRIWDEIQATSLFESSQNATKPSKLPYIMTVAMALIALITIYYLIIANQDLDHANEKIVNIEQANTELRLDNDKLKYNFDSLNTISNIYNIENTKIYLMKANRRNAPNSIVVLVLDNSNNRIYLDIKQFPNSSTGKKYFLWGITQIGRQIELGSFTHSGGSQTIELDGIRDAVRYILTLEKESGVNYPTMSKVYTTAEVY